VPRPFAFILLVAVYCGPPGAVNAQSSAASRTFDVAFVTDGAGNYQMASKMLRAVVAETGAPLNVTTFVWSHGLRKIMPDQTDVEHARKQGKLLADTIIAYHHQHPEARIHILAHSAGSMVALSATDFLPPATLDRIVLLSPSVSTEYDVRPALRSVKGSVEVHYSCEDWFFLGFGIQLLGCADRGHTAASGRVGFELRIDSPDDTALMHRLMQYPWQPADRELGNDGGHYGAYQPAFLKERILPVLLH
jgi:hypothetical protein